MHPVRYGAMKVREIQLLSHDSLDNIFLGPGGFHMEKVVIACLGKYFKGTCIESSS